MTTSVREAGLEANGAAPRAELVVPAVVPAVVPMQPAGPAAAGRTTSLQPPARMPAARMGLGTQALATAMVVRSCPPGHLRTALDALAEPGTR